MARILLSDESGSDSSDAENGGADVPALKVNQEFAQRFEYNKKREELQKLEEKLGKSSKKRKRVGDDEPDSAHDSDTSSSSEDEDDDGEFATHALDNEIMATLKAIKSKDPRVYDDSVTFYTEIDQAGLPQKKEKDKPMYLRDYHRENLLNGVNPGEDADVPMSYSQQQHQLKKSILGEIHAAAASDESEVDGEHEGGLLVRKEKQRDIPAAAVTLDVENADRDPETFLSNFMAARAWVPADDKVELHPFESDDEEEDKRAEEFEEAYNLRFENPEKANATLRSYDRSTAEKYSVRRDDKNSRQKKRDAEKAAKEAGKLELREEKARLKKLRMEEVEEKLRRVKRAAGLKSTDIQLEDWQKFIDDDWDDSRWEQEMDRRFGDQYYADQDGLSQSSEPSGDEEGGPKKKKKPKKPKFDDDIDIKDIVPDFQDEEPAEFSLSDDQEHESNDVANSKRSKSKKQERIDKQKESRRERRIIEQLVDDQLKMDLDHALPASSRSKSSGFRYRETSPQAFGLSTREILLADDAALNQFAGLKKLASWRDEERKRKDRKHLGKKARLRKWRFDTFGDENGPQDEAVAANGDNSAGPSDDELGGVDIREGGKKKKARRRKKAKTGPVTSEA